jgi:hypothetical protein
LDLLVIDDCSTDGTFETISKLFPAVRVHRNNRRRLLAYSRNVGMVQARGNYLFFIDDDNVVDPDAIRRLITALTSNENVGVVMPLAYYYGKPSKAWSGAMREKVCMIPGSIFFWSKKPTHGEVKSAGFHNAFLMKRKVVEDVGLFDFKNFPICLSELDYYHRMKDKGYDVLMVPTAKVYHDIAPFFGSKGMSALHIDEVKAYYLLRNRALVVRKYYGRRDFALFVVSILPFLTLVYLMSILLKGKRSRKKLAFNLIRGICDALRTSQRGGKLK